MADLEHHDLHWLSRGEAHIDTEQRSCLVEAIMRCFSPPEFKSFVGNIAGLKSLDRYVLGAEDYDQLAQRFVERIHREAGHLGLFVAAFHGHSAEKHFDEVLAFRQAFSRGADPTRTKAFRPRDQRWEKSQQIADALTQDVHFADMFPQRNKLVVAAQALVAQAHRQDAQQQGGYIPLVAVLRGVEPDMPNEFVRRCEDEFLSEIERALMPVSQRHPILGEQDRRSTGAIFLNHVEGLSAENKIRRLAQLLCEELAVVEDVTAEPAPPGAGQGAAAHGTPHHLLGADQEAAAFRSEIARAASASNRRTAVFLHVTSREARPWYRDVLETWLAHWDSVVGQLRFRRPLVHIIYFTQAAPAQAEAGPEPAPRGWLARWLRRVDPDDRFDDPFEDAWMALSRRLEQDEQAAEARNGADRVPAVRLLPMREQIDWGTVSRWCASVQETAEASREDWRHFEMHLRQVFDEHGAVAGGALRLQAFQDLLREFPDTAPRGG